MASDESTAPRFLTRDELLSPPALDERTVSLDGFGDVLVGELTGEQRGAILAEQAQDAQGEGGRVDFLAFQRKVLAQGILDAGSPREARLPLLKQADVAVLMKKLGGAKVDVLLTAIMELSGMVKAEVVKGNLPAAPSDA